MDQYHKLPGENGHLGNNEQQALTLQVLEFGGWLTVMHDRAGT
jgi:hypothetical protein